MPISDIKNSRARWSFLSKIDTLGSLDFWNLTVGLDSLQSEDTQDLDISALQSTATLEMRDYQRYLKVFPLAVHEYAHFVDATSTLWGMRHLQMLDNCQKVPADDESAFHVLKSTYDIIRLIRLPDYYTVVEKNAGTGRPWRTNFTSGVMFNPDGSIGDRPILFVRFWNSDKEPIVRSPISLVSLLEASAMEREIHCRAMLLRRLPLDERLVEHKLAGEELLDYFYNPHLTEYSVCFHLLGILQGGTDLATISIYTGMLARLMLNVPEIAFATVLKNIRQYSDRLNLPKNHPSALRMERAMKMHDRGALFYLISLFLPKNALNGAPIFLKGVDASLKTFGLSLEKLRRGACTEMEALAVALGKSDNPAIRALSKAGHHNFNILSPNPLSYPLEELALPPALLGDLTPYYFSQREENILRDYSLDDNYENLIQAQIRAENFSEACR